jgi:hypothetical protein
VNMAPGNAGHFLRSGTTVSFSRRAQLQGVSYEVIAVEVEAQTYKHNSQNNLYFCLRYQITAPGTFPIP